MTVLELLRATVNRSFWRKLSIFSAFRYPHWNSQGTDDDNNDIHIWLFSFKLKLQNQLHLFIRREWKKCPITNKIIIKCIFLKYWPRFRLPSNQLFRIALFDLFFTTYRPFVDYLKSKHTLWIVRIFLGGGGRE